MAIRLQGEDIFAYADAVLDAAKAYAEQYGYSKTETLSDETKTLYGKGSSASPDEIFAAIKPLIQAAENKGMNIESGSYTGISQTGGEKTLYCSFNWKIFYLYYRYVTETNTSYIYTYQKIFFKPNGHGLYWSSNHEASGSAAISVSDKSITIGENHSSLTYGYTFFG